ncbi:MAG TPA: CofH family radical SAM protein [Prolixibacteraceae bacterium]|nr:CofH family radical SAM protein [Prolixibacteraceae bacterium]HPL44173.1 CofH family radical SAM protein [Prolixibacteraceae bacterium]HQE52086.1 CofH family radical SAM protein [Prolixibacteraceae bacterium]HQH76485.1 CofH family radical SAM protein [Prolixibacteraceae bacterium]HQJ84212.1 CofH family radical SAM protein [Prolixibacteraceae bacterium]
MDRDRLFRKALAWESLSVDEGLSLYEGASTGELMAAADELRRRLHPENHVGWIIDRNINITNVCISGCLFCNFHCRIGDAKSYITTLEEYIPRIEELFRAGGNQVLLQGGMHPRLGLDFYTALFRQLKSHFPALKLHALGPPEIVFIARKERKSYRHILEELVNAGLESLPGAGAEILSDRVRHIISPGKCKTGEWLDVMREAHRMNLVTSATMMYGHAETLRERIEHLDLLRRVQSEKPDGAWGFVTFVPWPFMEEGTELQKQGVHNRTTADDYLRLVAISRLMLNNIENIQASWLTVGVVTGQLSLHGGANDFGSIMMEENVVSAAGARYGFDAKGIQQAIRDAGFEPRYRNQAYQDDELNIKMSED